MPTLNKRKKILNKMNL
jgi:hypothetical protein